MKVAIVTGATRGIGKACAIKLAQSGYHVVINYNRNESLALEVLEECSKYQSSIIFKADVSSFSQAEELVNEAITHFGKIDCLVNNAGITKDTLLLKMSEEDFDKVIEVNLKGCFNMSKLTSKYMIKNRYGKIVNISSIVGITGNAGQSNYAASKGALIAFTKSLAKELASRNINVNAVAPGFIKTGMTEVLKEDVVANLMNQIPLKKLGTPQDVANVVAFLASEDADYITGQVWQIDGGMVM